MNANGNIIIRVPYRENIEPSSHPDYPYHMAHLRNFDEYSLCLFFEKIFEAKVVDQVKAP